MAQLLFSLFILALFATTITPTSTPTHSGITTPTNSDDLMSAAPTTTPTSAVAATISTDSVGLISAAQSTTPTKTITATSSSSAGSTITATTLDVSINSPPVLEALLRSHHQATSSSTRVTTTTSVGPPAITTTTLHSHKVYHVFLFFLLLVTVVSLVGFFNTIFFRKSDKATEQPKPDKKDKKPVPRADSSQPHDITRPFQMQCAGHFCKVISNLPKDIKLSWSERGPVLDSDKIKPYFPNFEEEP